MRELIGVAILIACLFGGTMALKNIHDTVRKAALEKAAQGLRSSTIFERGASVQSDKFFPFL